MQWSVLCFGLSRLQSTVIQLNSNLGIAGSVIVGVIKVHNQVTVWKWDYPRWYRWAWFNQLKGLKCRTETSLEKECPWWVAVSAPGWEVPVHLTPALRILDLPNQPFTNISYWFCLSGWALSDMEAKDWLKTMRPWVVLKTFYQICTKYLTSMF